ncbi:TPA: hypothetical protein N0F65_002564 [Lagenidium giganteum]|uniref:Uncharacterized protein n=1 Tax=Lagenidium giganteum TaxID=4803 RepID=A0AAV2YP65_9STRA|nr:TPA: hypothetical protein N0F65_002564 [Lagenidium giganteum]
MADIIDKIGKYFADQEAQLRQVYAQASTDSAQRIVYASATKHPADSNRVSATSRPVRRASTSALPQQTPSLVRRRLSLERTQNATALQDSSGRSKRQPKDEEGDEEVGGWRQDDNDVDLEVRDKAERLRSQEVSSQEGPNAAPSLSGSTAAAIRVAKRRKKAAMTRKHKPTAEQKRAALAQAEKVAAAWKLTQERARKIQLDQLTHKKRQEQAKEDSILKIQEQLLKIEAIRKKNKQLAPRSRSSLSTTSLASDAPPSMLANHETISSGAQTHSSSSLVSLRRECSPSSSDTSDNEAMNESDVVGDEEAIEAVELPESSFFATLEAKLRQRMRLQLTIKERYLRKQTTIESQKRSLEARLSTQSTANRKKQQHVESLQRRKLELEQQLSQLHREMADTRINRRALEDQYHRERTQRQREVERELRDRLRKEEWQSLLDEERQRTEVAAEARARAKERVQSRTHEMKKMLLAYSRQRQQQPTKTNQGDEHATQSVTRPAREWNDLLLPPELAEFEEDGLISDLLGRTDTSVAGNVPQNSANSSCGLVWDVPKLSTHLVNSIVLGCVSSDEEDGPEELE